MVLSSVGVRCAMVLLVRARKFSLVFDSGSDNNNNSFSSEYYIMCNVEAAKLNFESKA